VVVVMPQLTTTVAEIEHVVDVLAAAIDAVWGDDTRDPTAEGRR
jgi:hypothetical protein